jgi:plastocyanin
MKRTTIALTVAFALVAALPATAATPTYRATVGPGFTITIAKKPQRPGKIRLVVADRSDEHNFHLRGPGVNVKTGVAAVGTRTFRITLKRGLYRFVCDPHATSMRGSFRIR